MLFGTTVRRAALMLAGPIAVTAGAATLIYKKNTKPYFGTEPGTGRHVVVLGSGWASMAFLDAMFTAVRNDKVVPRVTVVSKNNYFLFTPLLPSVVCGTLEVDSLCAPVRETPFAHRLAFLEGEAVKVDPTAQVVTVASGDHGGTVTDLKYDVLVVAVGATNNSFNTPGVADHAHFLKDAGDATCIRRTLLDNLEHAALPGTPLEEKKRLLTTVVCGGGPTGVEAAGEIMDFIHDDVPRLFGKDVAALARVVVVNSGDHILNTYDAAVSAYAEERFTRARIDVIKNCRVTAVGEGTVSYMAKSTKETTVIPTGLVIWATGIAPRPITLAIARALPKGSQQSRTGLAVGPSLEVIGAPAGTMYAIGDCSTQSQTGLVAKLNTLFAEADTDHSGALSSRELEDFFNKASVDNPSLAFFAARAKTMFKKFDTDGNGTLSKDEFNHLLEEVDRRSRPLPATAQVAAQMGAYLGKNVGSEITLADASPFEYEHRGSFSYVGGEKAVMELDCGPLGKHVVTGDAAMVLWRGAYVSTLVSIRTRVLVLFDWTKVFLFGRCVSTGNSTLPSARHSPDKASPLKLSNLPPGAVVDSPTTARPGISLANQEIKQLVAQTAPQSKSGKRWWWPFG